MAHFSNAKYPLGNSFSMVMALLPWDFMLFNAEAKPYEVDGNKAIFWALHPIIWEKDLQIFAVISKKSFGL